MPLRIRAADCQSDRDALIQLLRCCLTPESDERRFRWLYEESPHGKAFACIVEDSSNGDTVGAAAAFPRRMYFDGREKVGCVFGDFCLRSAYRSLGPAMQLQRACLEVLGRGKFEFAYDFPSTAMMAVYHRLGLKSVGNLVRYARPLRAEHRLEKIVKSKTAARILAAPANLALATRRASRAVGVEFSLHSGCCGEEFSFLDRETSSRQGVHTSRAADFLNWRFLAHPTATHDIVTARRSGELHGYVVVRQDQNGQALIADVNVGKETNLVASLLDASSEILRKRGALTVTMPAGEQHPWREEFARVGFLSRETAPVVSFAPFADTAPGKDWYLMQCERDS